MIRSILALLLMGLMVCPYALADTFELKAKKIKVGKDGSDVLPEIELRPQKLHDGANGHKFRSENPQTFLTRFGQNEGYTVTFGVDEKRGSGKGFDLIFADVTSDGNKPWGKKLSGKISHRGYRYKDTAFPPFELKLDYAGGSTYPVQARFSTQADAPSESSLYLTPLCILEGSVGFGENQQKMMVFDANCNGVFGESGTPGNSSARGDKVWIGRGSPKAEDAYVDALPIGKYYMFEGEYYEISFDNSSSVDIKKAEVALGKIRVNNPGFILELIEGSSVLYVSSEKGREIAVPEGSYKINSASFRRKHKGKTWELEGKPGSFGETFSVKENEVTDISVGPPLKIMISASTRPMGLEKH